MQRVTINVSVVIACADGKKVPARASDVSNGGMFAECAEPPAYGEEVTVVVRLDGTGEWTLLPARVRWVTARGCGVEFGLLDSAQRRSLDRLINSAAA